MLKNENGRSMVEMLGVLAIIGVLSVAGISGYTMAMNKYRANEILNTASMLAVIAQTQHAGAGLQTTDPELTVENAGLTKPAGVTSMKIDSTNKITVVTASSAAMDVVCKSVPVDAPFTIDGCNAGTYTAPTP